MKVKITLGCSNPILDEALATSTCNLSFVGGSSSVNLNSSSHLGSLFFFICCTRKKLKTQSLKTYKIKVTQNLSSAKQYLRFSLLTLQKNPDIRICVVFSFNILSLMNSNH
ncbi:hypothetical protein Hdeb2414_s0006g00201231 [Helianthus debilis subsp. tardiflorus]